MKAINYSKNIVGCNIGGNIFIHPELHKHPKLYKAILSHEKKHSTGFKSKDAMLDLFNDDLKDCKGDFYRFLANHPRTLLGYLPITKVGPYWGFDLEMFIVFLMALGFIWFIGVNI